MQTYFASSCTDFICCAALLWGITVSAGWLLVGASGVSKQRLQAGNHELRLAIDDFNVLEPNHIPRYRMFKPFEYAFNEWFATAGYCDTFRELHPDAREYSWVSRTGDGSFRDRASSSASTDSTRESGLKTAAVTGPP